MSRKAAKKGNAVLEGVGLDMPTINACFKDFASEEEAIQAGLQKWIEGKGLQPPTWKVLFNAITHAEIAQQHINDLKEELGLPHYRRYYFILAHMQDVTSNCIQLWDMVVD